MEAFGSEARMAFGELHLAAAAKSYQSPTASRASGHGFAICMSRVLAIIRMMKDKIAFCYNKQGVSRAETFTLLGRRTSFPYAARIAKQIIDSPSFTL